MPATPSGPGSWGRYWLVVARPLLPLGLTAKPMLVTFAVCAPSCWTTGHLNGLRIADCGLWIQNPPIRNPQSEIQQLGCRENPLVRPGGGFVRGNARRPARFDGPSGTPVLFLRLANAAVAYVAYLGKMLYPADLAVLYPLPNGPPPVWEVVAAVALLLAIPTAVIRRQAKVPLFAVRAGYGTSGHCGAR